MAKYTNLFQVLNDTELYMSRQRGEALDLGHIQNLARGRWGWIVDNWTLSLKERFRVFANGNGNLLNKLADFDGAVMSYKLGNLQNPFDSADKYIDFSPFLNLIKTAELTLKVEEQIVIDQELSRIDQLLIEDFRDMLAFIRKQSALASFKLGLGDADGARLEGVMPVKKERTAAISDLVVLSDLDSIREFIEGIVINFKQVQDKAPDLLKFANKSLGTNSDFTFSELYRSSVAVPFAQSLENMAKIYLGSADRYFELVTINNLQPPYIDEVGEKFSLLAPGAVNNLIISSARKNDVPVGTKVNIGSFRVREEARIVERVVDNADGTLILFLSGAQDLAKLKATEGSYVRIYAPGTVNSGSFILIPLAISSPNLSKYTPRSDELRRLDKALLNFGVDILRDERSGGLVVDSNSNFKFAAGLVAVRQAVLFAMRTVTGELPFHPNFGIAPTIGGRYYGTADEAVKFASSLRRALLRDRRFSDIQIAGLQATNTGIALNLVVSLVGANVPIPLSFIS